MLAESMTFTMCRDTMLLVLSSVFFKITCSQNFLFLFDHHVSVIIFCDKFEHDSFKFEHDSFKFEHNSFKFEHDSFKLDKLKHSFFNMIVSLA